MEALPVLLDSFTTPIAKHGPQKEEGTGFYPRHIPQRCNGETTANLNLWCKIIKVPFLLQPHGSHCVPQHPRMNSLMALYVVGRKTGDVLYIFPVHRKSLD